METTKIPLFLPNYRFTGKSDLNCCPVEEEADSR